MLLRNYQWWTKYLNNEAYICVTYIKLLMKFSLGIFVSSHVLSHVVIWLQCKSHRQFNLIWIHGTDNKLTLNMHAAISSPYLLPLQNILLLLVWSLQKLDKVLSSENKSVKNQPRNQGETTIKQNTLLQCFSIKIICDLNTFRYVIAVCQLWVMMLIHLWNNLFTDFASVLASFPPVRKEVKSLFELILW